MGQEEVPGHVEAGGDGRAEQEGGGLEQGGAEAASINLRKNLDGTPLMLSRIGLRVVLERNVIQSAALYLPDWPVFQHLTQHPLMAFPIVTV